MEKEVMNTEVVESQQQSEQIEKKKEKKSLVKKTSTYVPGNLNMLNLFDSKQLTAAENFLTKIVRSEKGGIKTVNDGLAVLMRAQDLNLPFSTCLEHIHVINGKTGVDIHIVKALLLKAGCTWICKKDYQPLYEFTDGINSYAENLLPEYAIKCQSKQEADSKIAEDKTSEHIYVYPVKWYQDLQGNVYKDYQLSAAKFAIALNKKQVSDITAEGKTPVFRIKNNPVDYETVYEIRREIGGKEMTSIGRFSYSDALKAEMFEKDTYKKYPRILIGHRAFTLAARDIASDIIMGVMTTDELKIVAGYELQPSDIEDAEIAEL